MTEFDSTFSGQYDSPDTTNFFIDVHLFFFFFFCARKTFEESTHYESICTYTTLKDFRLRIIVNRDSMGCKSI